MVIRLFLVSILLITVFSVSSAQQKTYVLVHGAWGGAWQFKKTAEAMQQQGVIVYRPTLTGLGERKHLANDQIDLNTHIEDVVNTILFEDLKSVVLVGHSYGGMVITGVADRIPDRIAKMIYIDALLPESGESLLDGMNLGRAKSLSTLLNSSEKFITPTWVRDTTKTPRDVPQPVKTFTQKLELKNPISSTIPSLYVFTYEKSKEEDDFYTFYQRAVKRGWKTIEMEASHNPQIDKREELVKILIKE